MRTFLAVLAGFSVFFAVVIVFETLFAAGVDRTTIPTFYVSAPMGFAVMGAFAGIRHKSLIVGLLIGVLAATAFVLAGAAFEVQQDGGFGRFASYGLLVLAALSWLGGGNYVVWRYGNS